MAQVLTKDGWLTVYALCCGYRERAGTEEDDIILDSMMADKAIFRVSWWEGNYRRSETYRSIAVARKAFKMVQSMKARVPSLSPALAPSMNNC
jgi:hypothetical protein